MVTIKINNIKNKDYKEIEFKKTNNGIKICLKE